MAYRRKAPPASQLSFFRQLQMLCNATAMGLPFQCHDSLVLYEQLKTQNPFLLEQFAKNASRQDFIARRVVDHGGGTIIKNAPSFKLRVPTHFIDPSESSESITPREFYHSSMVKASSDGVKSRHLPRCGLTGLFFSREEIVDNLQAAAADLGFSSPFWIRTNHPLLGDFLQVKDGSEAICLSITASVLSIDNLDPFPLDLLHPLLRQESREQSGRLIIGGDISSGMNAFSGFVTQNPFVKSMPNKGVWISQEQIYQHNLVLKKGISETDFVLVEMEQLEMHNADQLAVPGRLALNKCTAHNDENSSIFM